MKLVTLSQYIDDIEKVLRDSCGAASGENYEDVSDYNDFLKRDLHPSQFVPCVDGKPIKEPRVELEPPVRFVALQRLYQKAQQAVIFEGWKVRNETTTFRSGEQLNVLSIGNEYGVIINFYFTNKNALMFVDGWCKAYQFEIITSLADLAAATIEKPVKLKV